MSENPDQSCFASAAEGGGCSPFGPDGNGSDGGGGRGRRRVYMDNSATSFPKPGAVHEEMARYATELGSSPGRGAYEEVRESARLMQQCRERICTLINGRSTDHVVFTLNATDALNLAIKGMVPPGSRGHIITTWMDHNSVLRPFNALVAASGGDIEQTRVECDPSTGLVDPDDIQRAIRPDTKLIATLHGSNVSGTVQPIGEIGRICREREIPFVVDAAQTIGHLPVDVEQMCIDLLAFPGHKGLLGPLGTGALYIRPGLEERLVPIREGGTGSVSESDEQPDFMPDKYEPGSHNAIGIVGLSAGLEWILGRGVESLWAHELSLIEVFLQQVREREADGVRVYGPATSADRCAVFSVRVEGFDDPVELSTELEQRFGVLTRPGLHCAPLAHETFGTAGGGGTTRLSFGPFVSEDDVVYAAAALGVLARRRSGTVVGSVG